MAHRSVTIELISKISEEDYEYKPTETSMPARAVVTHMMSSFQKFAAVVKQGDASPMREKLEVDETNLNAVAEHYTSQTRNLLESLTDEELDRVIDLTAIFGMKISGRGLLQVAMDHEIHHKGSLFVYVREMGHTKLPSFVEKVKKS